MLTKSGGGGPAWYLGLRLATKKNDRGLKVVQPVPSGPGNGIERDES